MIRYLRLFLAAGIPCGILTGTIYSLRIDLHAGITYGISTGLVAGLVISGVLSWLHKRSVHKIINAVTEDTMGVHHTRDIELRLPYYETFDLCVSSLKLFKRCTTLEESRREGKIIARAGINWKTWSDTITFNIEGTDSGHTRVRLSSRPTARTTLVDFGKNLDNVEKVTAFLKTHDKDK